MMTNKQKLRQSLDMVQRIFAEAARMGVTLHRRKSRVSDITLATYEKQVMTILRKVAKRFRVYDITRVTEDMIVEVLTDYTNPYTLKKAIHALAFLQFATEGTRVPRKPLKLINKNRVLGQLREQKVVRRVVDSTVYQADEVDVWAVVDQIKSMRTPFKRLTVALLLFSMYTGARIDGALNVRNQDIVITQNGRVDVHLLEKGGLHRWVRIWDPDAVIFLKSLKAQCRSERSRIFTFRNQRTRQIKTNKQSAKTIQAVIRTAARNTGRIPEGQHFTPHSARKSFARSRMLMYTEWSLKELYGEVEDRCRSSDIVAQKFRRNMRRTPKRLSTVRRKLILFLITLDLGHFRLNVLGHYLDINQLNSILKQQTQDNARFILENTAA